MMADASITRNEIIGLVVRLSLVSAVTFFSIKWLIDRMDPTSKTKKEAMRKAKERLKKLSGNGSSPLAIEKLSEYEIMIATHIINPEDMTVTWSNIAGLEPIISELKETVIFPIKRKELFADSQLTKPPKGILLHGPPGCGKTLIAKAAAKEAGTRFINLDLSTLTDKWYGESQKLASAVFSLARKLQPCIIFIDEIDSFLRARNSTDHEATAMMKAQFMSFWDGLITDPNCVVIIMGATNRPQDLDAAILRRMPTRFHIDLPSAQQRHDILELILRNEPVSGDVDVDRLARMTNTFSGSDLRELCRGAATYRLRDYLHSTHHFDNTVSAHTDLNNDGSTTLNDSEEEFHDALRPITMDDLVQSLNKMQLSKVHCGAIPLPIRLD